MQTWFSFYIKGHMDKIKTTYLWLLTFYVYDMMPCLFLCYSIHSTPINAKAQQCQSHSCSHSLAITLFYFESLHSFFPLLVFTFSLIPFSSFSFFSDARCLVPTSPFFSPKICAYLFFESVLGHHISMLRTLVIVKFRKICTFWRCLSPIIKQPHTFVICL